MSHFNKTESIATNTLLIPDIPACFYGCDDAMLLIHDAFAEFGPLYKFVQMKGFRRLMLIFQETQHAVNAKTALDKNVIVWKERLPFPEIIAFNKEKDETTWQDYEMLEIRVYFGQHFAIHVDPALNSLQVPQFQRNLLISPPGSPFDGWEQIAEDPPNQAVLGSDLMAAAEVSDYELDQDELQLEMKKKSLSTPSRFNIVCSKGTEQPEHLPSITVEDWDGHIRLELDGEKEEANRKKKPAYYLPTSMPPSHF
ncbi:hypothetical protein INT48_002882 [Thamnidium elegans]|uniref:Calcipressin n=1 Tax=Thamnidium elegans TaxID=101142 RepID=A0A8H7VWS9_9FUNG|nr:hypothetical protein INT48_002882 [Thamnidium elegans]